MANNIKDFKMEKKVTSNTPFTWCEDSAALVVAMYEKSVASSGLEVANSKENLTSIGRAVAEERKHAGKAITMNSVRSKLSAEKVYQPTGPKTSSRKGTTISKADVRAKFEAKLNLHTGLNIPEGSLATLANGNLPELQLLSEAIDHLILAKAEAADPKVQVEAEKEVHEAEQLAIDAGINPEAVQAVEVATALAASEQIQDAMGETLTELQAESAENLAEIG